MKFCIIIDIINPQQCMKYKDIIEFFDAIEKNISDNINFKNRNSISHNIVITIYINMTSGKTHKATFDLRSYTIIYSSSIVKMLKEKFGVAYVPNGKDDEHFILRYKEEGKPSGDNKQIITNTELIRFIDAYYITDMTYVIKFSKRE